jgi:hypothetical protein
VNLEDGLVALNARLGKKKKKKKKETRDEASKGPSNC